MKLFKFVGKIGLLGQVLLSLGLGILVGIFLGEAASALDILGMAYVGLLQMTVLPYILVSTLGAVGRLDATMAKKLGLRGGALVLFVWSASMLVVLCMPLAYPKWKSAGFFSTSEQSDQRIDMLTLFIPSNPFHSFANTIVPAAVVFSIMLGVALISIPGKQGLLDVLGNLASALMGMASFVAKLAPFGIFAIAASAAGTLRLEEVERLQVYFWVYLAAWALLTFVTLPLLVVVATPFSYREVVGRAGVAMITAFATGTVLVVLPMIVESCKDLLAKHEMGSEESDSAVDVFVPTAYSFPSAGTILGLGFVLFAAWFVGSPLSVANYPEFTVVGTVSSFGKMVVAIPFMLDHFNLPSDMFQLYLLASVVTGRVSTTLAALYAFVVCLLVATSISNKLKKRALLQAIGVSIIVTVPLMWCLGFVLTKAIPYQYMGGQLFESANLTHESAPIRAVEQPLPLPQEDRDRPRLSIIRQRGVIRVGYLAERLPFVYKNESSELVGYDMDLVHDLAGDLDVTMEISPCTWETAGAWLDEGRIDVLVGGLPVTPRRAEAFTFTHSYLDLTAAFIVRDHRRDEFSSRAEMRRIGSLRIAVPKVRYYDEQLFQPLPDLETVRVDSFVPFFRGEMDDVDALVFSAEHGTAWTLMYPEYSVVVPADLNVKLPIGLGLPRHQPDFLIFMNTWLDLKSKNGITANLYRYWIKGEGLARHEPRWSIMRNVLEWTE